MRLIDADALYEQTAEWEAQALHMVECTMNNEDQTEWRRWSTIYGERSAFKHDVMDAPIIEERKKGKWILVHTGAYDPRQKIEWRCSECGAGMYRFYQKFCHECGAEMVEQEEDYD